MGAAMTTKNAQNNYPIRDFVKAMQEQFGRCEYKATAGDGTIVQSPGYIDTSHMKSVCADFRGGSK